MPSRALASVAAIGIVTVYCQAEAGSAAELQLEEDATPLLDDRLLVRLPASAKREGRPHDIMGAPHPNREEDRAVVDVGKERFVIMAYELFALAGDDFESGARALAAQYSARGISYEPGPLQTTDGGMQAVLLAPGDIDRDREAVNILVALLSGSDGSVIQLSFYINPEATVRHDEWVELSRQIASAAAPGPRNLFTDPGTRKLTDELTVELPEGYVNHLQRGPDFDVHHVVKLGALGKPSARMGIYFGMHPSYLYVQAGVSEESVTETKCSLLGTDTTWSRWRESDAQGADGTLNLEAMVADAEWWVAHFFLSASSDAELSELKTIAESVRAHGGTFKGIVHDEAHGSWRWLCFVGGGMAIAVAVAVVMRRFRRRRHASRKT
ncbi:MAG: hypothetical protein ACYS9X_08125 [Planctomycetota bacterium]